MAMNGTTRPPIPYNQEVAAQDRGSADRAVRHAAQRQRDQGDDDQRVEDNRPTGSHSGRR